MSGYDYIENITTGEPDNETSWVRIPDQLSYVGSPWRLVNGRFDKTAEFASSAFGLTTDYMQGLSSLVGGLEKYEVDDIELELPTLSSLNVKRRPSMSTLPIDTNWPANTVDKPSLESLPDIPVLEFPAMSVSPPAYTTYTAPGLNDIQEPSIPILGNVNVPVAPDYVLPEAPTLGSLNIPSPPTLTVPVFDAELTDLTSELPIPASFSWNSSPYNSEVWDTFLAKVVDGIVNGGTGLDPEVEQAIFDRAKYRQLVSNDKAYREVEKYFSSRGFTAPPGAMATQLLQISAEILLADADLNNSILIEQAKLAQDNTHFMLEMGRQAEVILRDFHGAQENRLLEAAKTAVTASVDLLNAHINKQNAFLEVYKTKAVVYGERIKALLAQVDIYKGQVEGVRVSAEVQKTQVEIYEASARMYSIQLESVKILRDIEALKIDIYKAETDVYVAKLSAEKNKVDIYATQVESERTKAQTYGEQIKAYIATVDAEKAKLEVRLANLTAVAQKNSAELERYRVEIGAYQVEVDAKAKQIGATTSAYEAEVSAYVAENSANNAFYDVKIKEMDAAINLANLNLQKSVAQIESRTQAYVAIKELEVKGTEGVMSVSAQLAASALSAVHASANYGYSGSEGRSHNFSYGASISENHSIPHDPPK